MSILLIHAVKPPNVRVRVPNVPWTLKDWTLQRSRIDFSLAGENSNGNVGAKKRRVVKSLFSPMLLVEKFQDTSSSSSSSCCCCC